MKFLPKFVNNMLPLCLYLTYFPIISLIFARCAQQSCTESDLKGCNALYWTSHFAAPSSLMGVGICNLVENRQSVPFAPHTCTGVSIASGSLTAGIFAITTYNDGVWIWIREQVQDKWSDLTGIRITVGNKDAERWLWWPPDSTRFYSQFAASLRAVLIIFLATRTVEFFRRLLGAWEVWVGRKTFDESV